MNRKQAFLSLALITGLLSCSNLNVTPVGTSSDSNTGSSSSQNIDPNTSSSSEGSVETSSSSNPDNPGGSSNSTGTSSSSTVVVPSSSSKVVDNGTYEKLTTANAQHGWGSRYWDGCKPHCSWRENVDTNAVPFTVCRNCNQSNVEIPAFTLSPNVSEYWSGYEGVKNSCDGGTAFSCFDMAPLKVNDTLAYAFVATSKTNAKCGQCFQIQFDGGGKYGAKPAHKLIAGKTLIVSVSNTGSDVEAGQFDIMIPGGGVGIYDSFSKQLGVAKSDLGAQYGGLLTTCQQSLGYDAATSSYQTCVRNKCNTLFADAKFADLKRGCDWFVDWLYTADNPTYLVKPVACPAYFTQKYPSTINTNKDTKITAGGY